VITIEYGPYYDELTGRRIMREAQYEAALSMYSPDGVYGTPSDPSPVYMVGGQPTVRSGLTGLLRGYLWSTPQDIPLPVSGNPTSSARRDLIVVRLDRDASPRVVGVEVIEGTPGAPAPAPEQATGDSGQYDLPLAEVVVPASGSPAAATIMTRCWYIGEYGQIRCTSSTRPPHSAGLAVWESGRLLVSTGTQWRTVSEATDWVNGTAASGWSAYIVRFRRVNGLVEADLQFRRVGGAITDLQADSQLGTVPAGYRPTSALTLPGVYDGPRIARCSIASNGTITLVQHQGIQTGQTLNFSHAVWLAA